MLLYALNIRREQWTKDQTAVRLPAGNLMGALKNYLQWVMLYASSREEEPGYFGLVQILGVHPDPDEAKFILVELGPVVSFDIPVTLAQIYGQHHNQPFYRYAHAFRAIPDFELERVFERAPGYTHPSQGFGEDRQSRFDAGTLPRRIKSSRIARKELVRFRMISQYGSTCPFIFNDMQSLDGQRYAIQVGHVRPLRFYGKDHLQNVLPMSSLANWGWDEGLISSRNNGKVLLASGLTEDTQQLFGKCEQIGPPKDLGFWPHGENFEFHRDVIFQRSLREREQARLALARFHGDGTL